MTTADPRRVKYELVPGEALGKYEILRKLAVGGMAELYLARIRGNAGFEKVVVLKRILPQVAEDPTFVQMFLEEARLAATLNHPNIAHVYDVGEVDGQHFFTMEFVHGQDVRAIRHEMKKREETVPLAIALAIVHGTAAALDYAHERVGSDGKLMGLVHRDVSASNVMVSYDGAIKLLDFGIARAATSAHKTQVGTLKGKVPYMSPEQCKGHPLDRRSDLFSLGVVMFEVTVGRRPFRGDSDFAIMDQIVYKGAPRPSTIVPGYPPALEAMVMKLLERDPKARYTTGEELIEDLDAFVQANSLWVSPTKIGKYMRTAFADRIQAWEDAEQQGVPFAQHVAHSITSQSQKSELVTPPSAFPGLPSKSAEMAAVAPPGPSSQQMAAAAEPPTLSMEPAMPVPRRTSQRMAAVEPAMPVPRRTPQPMAAQRPSESMAAQRMPDPMRDERTVELNKRTLDRDERTLDSDERSTETTAERNSDPTLAGPKMPLVAPPSAPVRVPHLFVPAGSPSSQMPVGSPSNQMQAVAAPLAGMDSMPVVPSLRPASSRTILFAFVGALAIGAGVFAFSMVSSSKKPASAPPVEVHATPVETVAPPAPPPVETKPPVEKPTVEKPVVAKPAVEKPAVEKPAVEKPTVEAKPPPETRPKPPVVTKPVTKPVVIKKPKPDKPKEQTWDPNSPFLPQ